MKKLLLTLIVAMFAFSAMAQSEAGFRDIPFGATLAEVQKSKKLVSVDTKPPLLPGDKVRQNYAIQIPNADKTVKAYRIEDDYKYIGKGEFNIIYLFQNDKFVMAVATAKAANDWNLANKRIEEATGESQRINGFYSDYYKDKSIDSCATPYYFLSTNSKIIYGNYYRTIKYGKNTVSLPDRRQTFYFASPAFFEQYNLVDMDVAEYKKLEEELKTEEYSPSKKDI